MKRLFVILFLIPSLAFGAYTEFYAQNGGSNLNAGSTNNNTAAYTSIHGNWTNATGVFTPTDGTTPASSVAVGDWASVYIDGASVGVYIGRISAVTAGVNGPITANTTGIGSKPANQTATATIKVGGAWQGPNAASGFPFTLTSWGTNKDATSHIVRTNLKNDQTYSMTASFAMSGGAANLVQGYTSSVGDGGRATFDGGTSTAAILTDVGIAGVSFVDIIFKTAFTSGSTDLVTPTRLANFARCVFTGARGNGINVNAVACTLVECEAYACNKSNTATTGGFKMTSGGNLYRCISHDNTGSNSTGIVIASGPAQVQNCISETNGQYGVSSTTASLNGQIIISQCDLYNNTSDGINIITGAVNPHWIENCNLIKNAGAGINNVSVVNWGYIYNCGYGAGTQANGSGDTINNLTQTGSVTFGSNLTPWVDPANGDFRINLAAANFAGRAAFTETAASYAGTVGYPDIGAAQSLTGGGGTFSKEVSYGYTQ